VHRGVTSAVGTSIRNVQGQGCAGSEIVGDAEMRGVRDRVERSRWTGEAMGRAGRNTTAAGPVAGSVIGIDDWGEFVDGEVAHMTSVWA